MKTHHHHNQDKSIKNWPPTGTVLRSTWEWQNTNLCPVKTILAYIAVRGSKQEPLFMFANQHRPMTDKLVSHLRVPLTKAGINPDFICQLWFLNWHCHGGAHERHWRLHGYGTRKMEKQCLSKLCENTSRTLSSTLLPHRYSSFSTLPPSPRRLAFSVTIMFVCIGIKWISHQYLFSTVWGKKWPAHLLPE